ncbi:hypothetical protein LIER_43058 [Lithospermum erythrorhizon]|uniref:Uncharacterized protein n=1 Tax=Lithospermum erythrorhizon TaxID=34254 RepID=A0AAV3PES4_LITER
MDQASSKSLNKWIWATLMGQGAKPCVKGLSRPARLWRRTTASSLGPRCVEAQLGGLIIRSSIETGPEVNSVLQRKSHRENAKGNQYSVSRPSLLLAGHEDRYYAFGHEAPIFFTKFLCKTDPKEHIAEFQSQMSFQHPCSKVYCRAFPSSLAGPALKWFNQRPKGHEAEKRVEKRPRKHPIEETHRQSPNPKRRSALDRIRAPELGYSRADLPRRRAFSHLQGYPKK